MNERNRLIDGSSILDALPDPVVVVGMGDHIEIANAAAEVFFQASERVMRRHPISHFIPFGSPVLTLIGQVRERQAPVNEYRIEIGSPRIGKNRIVDVHAAPVSEYTGAVTLMFEERGIADKIDRQFTSRGAARTVTGLAAMLAHEIKNPLSGIRGAAQLLDQSAEHDDRLLTRLIMDETDRIVKLVDRMEVFSDERPVHRESVNIHDVFDHVRRLAQSGFASSIRFVEAFDPSLPSVFANRDQLVQVFLNLVKNAAEMLDDRENAEIALTTAFRPGIRVAVPGAPSRVALPLEFCVRDNGPGVPSDLLPDIFDPFVTSKPNGSGLGLALVAKIIGDHGGIIECDSLPGRTVFRILMPAYSQTDMRSELSQVGPLQGGLET